MKLTSLGQRWPRGTGEWNRARVVIVANEPDERDRLARSYGEEHEIELAASPLEVIRRLENEGAAISTVVISEVVGSVCRAELVAFLADAYPWLRVILAERRSDVVVAPDHGLEAFDTPA